METRRSWVIFYDAECGICRRWVSWLVARDRNGVLDCRPIQDAQALARFRIPPEAAQRTLHALDLNDPDRPAWTGAEAAIRAMASLDGLGWLARWTPRWLARGIYRVLIAWRGNAGCGPCSPSAS